MMVIGQAQTNCVSSQLQTAVTAGQDLLFLVLLHATDCFWRVTKVLMLCKFRAVMTDFYFHGEWIWPELVTDQSRVHSFAQLSLPFQTALRKSFETISDMILN